MGTPLSQVFIRNVFMTIGIDRSDRKQMVQTPAFGHLTSVS
jgi:hypothetical protein